MSWILIIWLVTQPANPPIVIAQYDNEVVCWEFAAKIMDSPTNKVHATCSSIQKALNERLNF